MLFDFFVPFLDEISKKGDACVACAAFYRAN